MTGEMCNQSVPKVLQVVCHTPTIVVISQSLTSVITAQKTLQRATDMVSSHHLRLVGWCQKRSLCNPFQTLLLN